MPVRHTHLLHAGGETVLMVMGVMVMVVAVMSFTGQDVYELLQRDVQAVLALSVALQNQVHDLIDRFHQSLAKVAALALALALAVGAAGSR